MFLSSIHAHIHTATGLFSTQNIQWYPTICWKSIIGRMLRWARQLGFSLSIPCITEQFAIKPNDKLIASVRCVSNRAIRPNILKRASNIANCFYIDWCSFIIIIDVWTKFGLMIFNLMVASSLSFLFNYYLLTLYRFRSFFSHITQPENHLTKIRFDCISIWCVYVCCTAHTHTLLDECVIFDLVNRSK